MMPLENDGRVEVEVRVRVRTRSQSCPYPYLYLYPAVKRFRPCSGHSAANVPRTVVTALLLGGALIMLAASSAPAGAQQTPPAPAAPRPVLMPEPVKRTLPNGMRVVLIQKSNVPLVSAQVVIATGAEADPAEQAGLADVTASLLTKGTQSRSAQQIAEAIEALGATMSARGGWDASRVSLTVMSTGLEPALRIVSEVVRSPTFAEEELKRIVDQRQDNLKVSLRDPGSLAFMT